MPSIVRSRAFVWSVMTTEASSTASGFSDDPQGHGRGGRRGAGRRALRRGAAELLVVEAAPRVHGEREPGTLERQPLHLHAAREQGKQPVAQDERVRGEEVPGERGGVRDGDAPRA